MTKFKSEAQGEYITLTVCLTYPGSKVSDILIGDETFQVRNENLKQCMSGKDLELFEDHKE